MANQAQPFRQHHIARALRAASNAGMRNPKIEVRLPTGASIVVTGDKDEPNRPAKSRAASRSSAVTRGKVP